MALDHSDLHPHQQKAPPTLPPQDKNAPLPINDFALESVIGDAFLLFGFVGDKPKDDSANTGPHPQENNADLDLEAAVGNAFLSLDSHFRQFEATPYKGGYEANPKEASESEVKLEERLERELSAVPDDDHAGDQMDDFHREYLAEPTGDQLHPDASHDLGHQLHQHLDHKRDDEYQAELDLEAAIGNAIKSVTGHHDLQGEPHKQHETDPAESATGVNSNGLDQPQDISHGEDDEVSHSEVLPNDISHPHSQSVSPSPEDDKLESAIGEAFKSLAGYTAEHEAAELREASAGPQDHDQDPNIGADFQGHQDHSTHHSLASPEAAEHDLTAAISASFDEIMGHKQAERRLSDFGLDLANVVQNVVQQMTAGDQTKDAGESLPESLAGSAEEKKEIPRLDENILAHFQMEANKDEEKFEDSSLKDAIANAVKSAMLKNSERDDSAATERPDLDLEKLQMNEILQNAFSMAMQNPQELLTSLNEEENDDTSSKNNISTAAAIAAMSMKEAFAKSDISTQSEVAESASQAPTKSLSIAETLALHRSSMSNAPRRDYSSINTLEDSMRADPQRSPQMNPQLSNILSSLSHHIQSGNQSQNLMLVIRKMTNALMLNKSSLTVNTAALDILKGAKSRPEDQKFLLESLFATKDFLSNAATTDLRKRALVLINNVIGLFKASDLDVNAFSETSSFTAKAEVVSDYYDSALAALSGFSSGRLRSVLAGIKPDLDSSEYKERIRIENRERKKKWREENAERNKDNDLRSRVIKRANNMFGDESTPEKKAWVEEEFNRRREKRLAKRKKEDTEKPLSVRTQSEPADTKPIASVYVDDERLVKRVSDIFSLVAETGLDDDPQAILEAASAATAVAASSYADILGLNDKSSVRSAVSQILTNVLDSTVRAGTFMRIPFLSKIYNTSRPSVSTLSDKNDIMSRLSALTGVDTGAGSGQKSALEILQSSRKRLGLEFLTSDLKKPRVDGIDSSVLSSAEKDKTSMSRIESEINQLRNSISASASSHLWNSNSGLKMPLYKKPTEAKVPEDNPVKKEMALPAISKPSPFISNKVGLGKPVTSTNAVGLRKPGSFQRPSYSKPPSKSGSLGFPTLYSPSFRLK